MISFHYNVLTELYSLNPYDIFPKILNSLYRAQRLKLRTDGKKDILYRKQSKSRHRD